jgi:Ca-activated chloride channel family protein
VSARSLFFVGLLISWFSTTAVNANEFTHLDPKQGRLFFKTPRSTFIAAPTINSKADIAISGISARVRVEHHFNNDTSVWQEGVYIFPLPDNAAVDTLRMKIGQRIIEGEIKEKQEAKKTYEKAKRDGRRTALVEQERANLFTTSVANIAPNESITVIIEYQQSVDYDHLDGFSLRFPTVVAPRYIPNNTVVQSFAHEYDSQTAAKTTQNTLSHDLLANSHKVTSPIQEAYSFNHHITDNDYQPKNTINNPIEINVSLNAGLPLAKINSLFHAIKQVDMGNDIYQLSLKNRLTPANRDFVLKWQPYLGMQPKAAAFKEQVNGDNYMNIMIMPPDNLYQGNNLFDREVIFVIDTSGSMGGESIIQAKRALNHAVKQLTDRDSFNIIRFDSHTDQLWSQSQLAFDENIEVALEYIDTLKAEGGTEMAPAMQSALTVDNNDDHRLRQVIFLTDGAIGNEAQLFKIIQRQLGDSRLFPIGIGSAPNSYFMTRAAKFGRGDFTYIGNVSEVKNVMSKLADKLAKPALSDIKINSSQFTDLEVWPENIADLYEGKPLVLKLKANKVPDSLEITGLIGQQQWQASLPIKRLPSSEGISKLWAREKIAGLMEDIYSGDRHAHDDNKQAIIDTALEHHLVSKFTSLVAVDKTPVRLQEELLKKRKLATNLPYGWDKTKFMFSKTATRFDLSFYSGLLFLLVGFFGMGIIELIAKRLGYRTNEK